MCTNVCMYVHTVMVVGSESELEDWAEEDRMFL